ncbi:MULTISPECIES: hypothetical protein [unclassified Mesorhizobium]|uniref:hypothetical protein n=1 Tax=unclassified Mesorhizobium TaxID=325217 RepID=UPI00112A87A6|nr:MULTISPECIES: hypothetical protein [unclassified Mesorhizobium]TPK94654.1 hypothetical protein FJ567_24175 [Mesorhizobium sp. B2-4-16]TPL67269.1 hypothetical protein FJ956_19715 [Mesorhizobium sp. B2-4-3]
MKLGYWPNPAALTRYNELMLRRKIVDRNPRFVTLTDKLAAVSRFHAEALGAGCVTRRRGEPRRGFQSAISPTKRKKSRGI